MLGVVGLRGSTLQASIFSVESGSRVYFSLRFAPLRYDASCLFTEAWVVYFSYSGSYATSVLN